MYLEGMEEASVFVHVAVNDITGKVGTCEEISSLCFTIEIKIFKLLLSVALHYGDVATLLFLFLKYKG